MLSLTLLTILLSMAVTNKRDKSLLYCRISLICLTFISLIAYDCLDFLYFCWGIGLFGGYFHATAITQVLQIFIFIISAIILQLTSFYPIKLLKKKSNYALLKLIILDKLGEQYKIIEYSVILLFIIMGASLLTTSSDIISLFISLELQSYGLYLLASLYRNSELSTSAGLLYFLLGGFSSCFILLGSALLYANSGTTSLEGYYIISNLSEINENYLNDNFLSYLKNYLNFSLILISVGFLFKLSAAPFHFWSPDVYDAIPTVVTTFVAIIAKISLFVFLLEIVYYTKSKNIELNWTYSLLFSCFLSLFVGTVLGLNQSRIKKLFAFSTISHVGFILLALALNTIESSQAYFFYLMQYSITNLNAFILLIAIGYSLFFFSPEKEKSLENSSDFKQTEKIFEQENSPLQLINQIKGYFFYNPVLSLSLAITIYSFVGIPPLIGFFAKQMVLSACLDKGYYFFALVAILTSVISAVYYLKIIQKIFMEKDNAIIKSEITFKGFIYNYNYITISRNLSFTISVFTLIILLYLLNPHEFMEITLLLIN